MSKGVSPHGKRWRVRKYGYHIGVYDTKEEAENAAALEDIKQEQFKYMQQYLEAKKWLTENGFLREVRHDDSE